MKNDNDNNVVFRVFVRNWWRRSTHLDILDGTAIYKGLVPDPCARKHTIGKYTNEADALAACKAYRATHEPGELSRKAEYESVPA